MCGWSKFDRLPEFCFYCGKLSHEIGLYGKAKEMSVGFEDKYVNFGDWLRAGLNMKVLDHVIWTDPVKRPMKVVGGIFLTSPNERFHSVLQ